MIIEGAISIKAAITCKKREVSKIYIDSAKHSKDFNYIKWLAHDNNIEIVELSRSQLEELASGKTFGGILAEVTSRIDDEFDDGDIFYIDGIEDPFNLGYIMRNLYAFGICNVLLAKRDYTNMQEQLLKSSAGAYDMLNVKVSDDSIKDITNLKSKGYTLYAMQRSDESKDVFDVGFKKKALFMLGGEKRGISATLLNLCDELIFIPYATNFRNALNACNAAAIVATLIYQERREK